MTSKSATVGVRRSVLRSILTRPVAFHPVFARICDSVTAGLMLSQALYWSERTSSGTGWFWKTQEQWHEETYLSKTEQLTARRILDRFGFMRSERRGIPAKLYFQMDSERVWDAIEKVQGESQELQEGEAFRRWPEPSGFGQSEVGVAAKKSEERHVQRSVLRTLLTRPIAFHPVLARICDSVTAGLMLSQAIY